METSNNAINNMLINPSWFRGDPYYWAKASLPFAYAAACVEVVLKENSKSNMIYAQMVEGWGKPGVKSLYERIWPEIPQRRQEEIKQAFIHPETYILPDPDKAFRNIENQIMTIKAEEAFLEEFDGNEDLASMVLLLLDYIFTGFNRESDIKKGISRISPSGKHNWLVFAIVMHTATEYAQISLEKLRDFYRMRGSEKSDVRFNEPMSRAHRRMIKYSKAVNLRLKNDRTIMNAARHWYQSRVKYTSINKYCEAKSYKGFILDPKNIDKIIRPCDDAVGYIRRLPKRKQN